MALHGEIKVNGNEVGRWEAVRISTGDLNRYRVCVDWTPQNFHRRDGAKYPMQSGRGVIHAFRHTFIVKHHHEDGAVALAAKVLSQCPAGLGEEEA